MSETPTCSCVNQRGLVVDAESAAICTTCGRPVLIPEESFQRRRWRDPDTDPEWRQFRRTKEMSSALFNEQEERRARDEPSVAEIVVQERIDNFKTASGEQVAATFAMVDVDAMTKRQEEFRGVLPASADGSRQLSRQFPFGGYGAEEHRPSMTELRMGLRRVAEELGYDLTELILRAKARDKAARLIVGAVVEGAVGKGATPRWSMTDIAEAIGVPRSTLHRWTSRGKKWDKSRSRL